MQKNPKRYYQNSKRIKAHKAFSFYANNTSAFMKEYKNI